MARGRKRKRKSRREEVGIYEAEKVIASRHVGGKVEFRIRWKGYGSDDDTWEQEFGSDGERRLSRALTADFRAELLRPFDAASAVVDGNEGNAGVRRLMAFAATRATMGTTSARNDTSTTVPPTIRNTTTAVNIPTDDTITNTIQTSNNTTTVTASIANTDDTTTHVATTTLGSTTPTSKPTTKKTNPLMAAWLKQAPEYSKASSTSISSVTNSSCPRTPTSVSSVTNSSCPRTPTSVSSVTNSSCPRTPTSASSVTNSSCPQTPSISSSLQSVANRFARTKEKINFWVNEVDKANSGNEKYHTHDMIRVAENDPVLKANKKATFFCSVCRKELSARIDKVKNHLVSNHHQNTLGIIKSTGGRRIEKMSRIAADIQSICDRIKDAAGTFYIFIFCLRSLVYNISINIKYNE